MRLQEGKINDNNVVSFEEALKKAGTGKFQYIVIGIGGLIIFSSYVSVGAVAYILPAAQCDLNMDSERKGRLASIGFIGLIISCHLWGFLSDTLGRRYIIIRCLLLDGLLYFITSLTPYYSIILFLRLLNGFVASGAVASVYAYIGEFQTDKNRTKAVMASAFVASFAYFIVPAIAWITMDLCKWRYVVYPGLIFKTWRIYYASCGIPSLICVILIYFLPESPKFLLAKEQNEKAIDVIKKIYKFNNKSNEEFSIKYIKINENEKVKRLGDSMNKVLAFLSLMWNQTAPLFKSPHRLNISLVCLTMFVVYFSNGGMYLWLPETLNRLANFRAETNNEYATFCEVVEYESQDIVTTKVIRSFFGIKFNKTVLAVENKESCSDAVDITVYSYLGILGILQTLNLGFITAVSKIFNKKYLLFGLMTGALLFSIAVQFVKVTDFSVYDACLIIIFTGAIIPILNSVVVELFPTNLRGMAGCLTLMSCRLGTVTTNIIAGSLIDKSCSLFVWFFIVASAIGILTITLLPMKMDSSEEKEENKMSSKL